jgi:hypothetical protein
MFIFSSTNHLNSISKSSGGEKGVINVYPTLIIGVSVIINIFILDGVITSLIIAVSVSTIIITTIAVTYSIIINTLIMGTLVIFIFFIIFTIDSTSSVVTSF